MNKVEQINALLKSIETGDTAAVAVVNEDRYIQHNPQTHEGSEGLAQLFERLSKTGPKVNMVRGFEDGDFVFAQMEYDFSSRKICFEVFRFEGGQAVEHWDNIQERQSSNASGHSMVDGANEITDLDRTEDNRALVRDFVCTVLVGGKLEKLGEFVAEDFIEHNPNSEDGLSALRIRLGEKQDSAQRIDYQTLYWVLAQGNFVLSVSDGYRGTDHCAFYDLFRVDGGKLVEHWDTTEKIAPRSEWKNENGKF